MAAIHHVACKCNWQPTEIVSDSDMAVTKMHAIIDGRRGGHREHADLWRQIEVAVDARDKDYFRCRWVPAHTKDAEEGEQINAIDQ